MADLPKIPELTPEIRNRLIAADWLKHLAKMVAEGAIEAFDIAWDPEHRKPKGKLLLKSDWLTTSVEIRLVQEEAQKAQANEIFVDLTKETGDHQRGDCEGEEASNCVICNDEIS